MLPLSEEKINCFDLEEQSISSDCLVTNSSSGTDSDLELVNSSPVLESAGKAGHHQGSSNTGLYNGPINLALTDPQEFSKQQ